MAKFISTHTPPTEKQHLFNFNQREIDLLMNILFDIVKSDAVILVDGRAYTPNDDAHESLSNVLKALDEVGMSLDNDYLSNFHEVVL